MRMLWGSVLITGALLAAPAAYAQQGPEYTLTITVTPGRVMPGETVRVTAPSPPANVVKYYGGESGFSYDVTLQYTTTAGTTENVSQDLIPGTALDTTFTVPETAKSGTVATITAILGYDSAAAYAQVGEDTAQVAVGPAPVVLPPPVAPVTGTLTLSRVRVPADGAFTVTGTSCRADRYAVRYRTASSAWLVVAEGSPDESGTFRARVAAEWLRRGTGWVSAVCGGVTYPEVRVRVLAAAPLLPRTGPPLGGLVAAGLALVAAGVACVAIARPARG